MADELTLTPFAAQLLCTPLEMVEGSRWHDLLSGLVGQMALSASRESPSLIGHIKAVAEDESGGVLTANAVDAMHPPKTGGALHEGTKSAVLTLNALVYGIGEERIGAIFEEVLAECGQASGFGIEKMVTASGGLYLNSHTAKEAT